MLTCQRLKWTWYSLRIYFPLKGVKPTLHSSPVFCCCCFLGFFYYCNQWPLYFTPTLDLFHHLQHQKSCNADVKKTEVILTTKNAMGLALFSLNCEVELIAWIYKSNKEKAISILPWNIASRDHHSVWFQLLHCCTSYNFFPKIQTLHIIVYLDI